MCTWPKNGRLFDIVDIVIECVKRKLKTLTSRRRYLNDTELATSPAINNTNIVQYIRLKIGSWIEYGYHFHHVKSLKELFEKGCVPVCYNDKKGIIVNTVKQMLNKYLDLPEVYVKVLNIVLKYKVSKLKKYTHFLVK